MRQDDLLELITKELVKKHKCHTVILYGSRARGDATEHSDYDLMGVKKAGPKLRIARKQQGSYIDIFVFPEKGLQRAGENHLYMSGGRILFDQQGFGASFLRKLKVAEKRKYKPLPVNDIEVTKVWLNKMYERTLLGDIEGNYRRAWLLEALLIEYFNIRKMRYRGSKQSFAWLKENDRVAYRLFERVLADPHDQKRLKRLVALVSEVES